jgi:hypothetical protein
VSSVINHLLLAAGEPSKVPFYIAGGALAVWAVVLATIGLARPAFPFHGRGARAVMGLSFVLAAVAIAMAIITSAFIKH